MKAIIIFLVLTFTFSGGDSNLNKRWRPSWNQDKPMLKYEDIDERTRWFVEDLRQWLSCPGDEIEMYVYGSRARDSWWFSSDFDIGIVQDVTPEIKQTVENCKRKFKLPENVNVEINRVYPKTDKRLVKVKNTTH